MNLNTAYYTTHRKTVLLGTLYCWQMLCLCGVRDVANMLTSAVDLITKSCWSYYKKLVYYCGIQHR